MQYVWSITKSYRPL